MWPVLSLQFNFEFLSNHAEGGGELITLSIYQFLSNPSGLGFVLKL